MIATAQTSPRGSLDLSAAKEQLSLAYVKAVVASALCISAEPSPDYDKVDLIVRQTADHLMYCNATLDLQLKATSQDVVRVDHIAYSLPAADYNALCETRLTTPRLLIVVVVPSDIDSWLYQHERAMLMRHCGYWISLRGEPPVTDQQSRTVHLPRSQRFDVDGLCSVLKRIGDGNLP